YIVTDSEVEALILECNLIKEHKPWYNVRLRDDKNYPYIKITNEKYPRVQVVRRRSKDGAQYFGPYTSTRAMRETIRLLRKLFPIRTCRRQLEGNKERPCLNYHIKRCLGPCTGEVSPEGYQALVDNVVRFLQGRQEGLIKDLKEKMQKASRELRFEEAAQLRDQILALEQMGEEQKITADLRGDQDLIGLAHRESTACVQIFFIREGKLIGRDHFLMEDKGGSTPGEILGAFMEQYYSQATYVPREVLLQEEVENAETLAQWLTSLRGTKVYLRVPQRGPKRGLMEMVAQNAELVLDEVLTAEKRKTMEREAALVGLQQTLGLPHLPQRIEGYDISNISGQEAVGSMVVFTGAEPTTDDYRRFKIRESDGPDDYGMLQETLRRRFRRGLQEQEEGGRTGFAQLPDLILIDGGKGQLNAARQVLEELKLEIPLCSLAEREEEIFLPGQKDPIRLSGDDPSLQLLQRIRDEAHRFALTYHRQLRRQKGLTSVLDAIPGIGAKRKRALIKHFGSVQAILQASLEEIKEVPGIPPSVAENVYNVLHQV
ncbi:MAG: excinuclease ABC subunit UvrC, partial [Limnochordia bacterium]